MRALLEIQIFRIKCKARVASPLGLMRGSRSNRNGFLGSESKFIVPLARPPGAMLCIAMKLASDPNNPASTAQRSNLPEK